MRRTGTVILVGDGISPAPGWKVRLANRLVEFGENGECGMALNLEGEQCSHRAATRSTRGIRKSDTVSARAASSAMPVGKALIIGRAW